jgi:hypothetical protein
MNNLRSICLLVLVVPALLVQSCLKPQKNKLKGYWHSTDGTTKLNITERVFSLEDGEEIPEDYYVKGDTIYTSFQGNEPLTRFVVQKLNDHYLRLLGPDSVAVEFNR